MALGVYEASVSSSYDWRESSGRDSLVHKKEKVFVICRAGADDEGDVFRTFLFSLVQIR